MCDHLELCWSRSYDNRRHVNLAFCAFARAEYCSTTALSRWVITLRAAPKLLTARSLHTWLQEEEYHIGGNLTVIGPRWGWTAKLGRGKLQTSKHDPTHSMEHFV
jgi:hypothetical protein